jgi:uncharacterized membrane protein YedE/YeeE
LIVGGTVATIDPVFQWSTKLPAQKDPVVVPLFVSLILFVILFAVFFASEYFKGKRREIEEPTIEFSLQDAQVLITSGYDEDRDAKKQPLYRLKRICWYVWDLAVAILLGVWYLCQGRPLRVLEGFVSVGCWVVKGCGGNPSSWKYWSGRQLLNPMKDNVFLSDISLLLGAFVAVSVMGKFGQQQEISAAHAIKAIIGGFAMGIGGVIGGGCTFGALLSGINSWSLHGWIWMLCALVGSGIAIGFEKCVKRITADRELYRSVG